tara:strand:+ start:14131 stop:14715 length:585 start_codon:yes stop_codon:yes gene_type:complete
MKTTGIRKLASYSATGVALALHLLAFSAYAQESIEVSSAAFDHDTDIPIEFSAYGDNKSPDISWGTLPEGTKQVALILDDPVVAMPQPFVHWVAYNIPATATGLPEGLSTDAKVMGHAQLSGMINGVNGTGRTGYFGPRPPADGKVHNYNFTVYALDLDTILPQALNKEALLKAMEGKVLASGTLTGNYQYFEQ